MSTVIWNVPAKIVTERLVIRRYEPADAEALTALAARNREHLLRFMPWARHEPQTLEQRREFLAQADADFESGTDFLLGLFDRTTGALIGSSGYHPRREPVPYLEIGYWIDADHEGQGLVTEAAAAQTRVALEFCGSPFVGIAHAPANTRSAAVPHRLGFERQPQREARTCSDGGEDVTQVDWHATTATLAVEPLASVPRPAVHGVDGHPLPWPL